MIVQENKSSVDSVLFQFDSQIVRHLLSDPIGGYTVPYN